MSSDVHKHIKFAAPYRSQTFNALDNLLIGRNGVVSGGEVSTSGIVATIQPLVFVQNGLLVEAKNALTAGIPASISAPYFIAVTVSSSVENVSETITPTFVKRPQDVSANTVLVAHWDGEEWIPTPRLQINEVIKQIASNVVSSKLPGIADGFLVTKEPSQFVIDPGSLYDTQGSPYIKKEQLTFSNPTADSDGWDRIDHILFRRPDDSVSRGGRIKYITGQTFDSTNAISTAHQTAVSASAAVKEAAKTLINPSTGVHYFLWLEDYGTRKKLVFATAPADLSSISPSVDLATSSVSDFDCAFGEDGYVHAVYTRGTTLYYRKFDTVGSPVISQLTVYTAANTLSQPKIIPVHQENTFYMHVLVKEDTTPGVVSILKYARLNVLAAIETTPSTIVDLSDLVSDPSVDKDDDDTMLFLAFRNASTGRVYLRQYDVSTATSSAAPVQVGSSLELGDDIYSYPGSAVLPVGGSGAPIVKRADNKDTFVFWLQNKGGGVLGVAAYGTRYLDKFGHKAILKDLITSGENFSVMDVAVDKLNYAHFVLGRASKVQKATLYLEEAEVGTFGDVNATVDPAKVRIADNLYGALVHTYSDASSSFVNNGSPVSPPQLFGAGTIGATTILANEVVILATEYAGLPYPPTSGDTLTVSGSTSNDGTKIISGTRNFTESSINYVAIACTTNFTPEVGGTASVQFKVAATNTCEFIKTTAGILDNLRGFTIPRTDILLAKYRTSDEQLSVAGYAMEETRTISRIYELFNSSIGGSGQVTWNIVASNKLAFGTAITIRMFNKRATYTIDPIPSGITIGNGQVAYVTIPDDDSDQTLTLSVVDFGFGVLDRLGRRAVPIFWNIGGDLFTRFAPFRLAQEGQTVILGETISQEFIDFVGAGDNVPDPTNHAYLSTNYILQTDDHNTAIGKLDTALAMVAAEVAAFVAVAAVEETQVVGAGGTNIYNNVGFTWNADPSKTDILVFVNGVKVQQDKTGGLTKDFRKNSQSQLEFAYNVPENSKITVRKQTVSTAPADEEVFIVPLGGQSLFTASLFTWTNDNTVPDIQVSVNGIKAIQDQAGGTTYDFIKTSADKVLFSYTVPEGSVVVIRKEKNGGSGLINVMDEGTIVSTAVSTLDFRGAGVTATLVGPNTVRVTIPGGGGAENFQKLVYNDTGVTIPANAATSWLDDGSVDLADPGVMALEDFAGVTVSAIPAGQYGAVYKGGNCPNVLSTLGALPGQKVYLGVTPGSLTLTSPNPLSYAVVQVGIAEPPTGFKTPNAVDLFMDLELISEP